MVGATTLANLYKRLCSKQHHGILDVWAETWRCVLYLSPILYLEDICGPPCVFSTRVVASCC